MTTRSDFTPDQRECYAMLRDTLGEDARHVTPDGGAGIRTHVVAGLATWDNDRLTRLVLLAHARCIRVAIHPSSPRQLTLLLHKRKPEGLDHERHPSLDQAIKRVLP